ncbi:class I SAM-dependent methyltransferase [Paraburkholderia sp. BL9I2N2]|jgi:predicted O-methyltransferase YrrM|uniref:class I SAM-dependent methyltransferase n=1 Tax=Paraburkholderia sp. BL9I2N2 TaxID=1938809 RepID=UPI0010E0E76E|nr:class I SAM-dependent methyltransferase [Paraburkholderia sp. BL9I2N2]TCK96564.1 methyltransferase family protein [Paraburkholderia sp. BL9I2N2]
MESPISLLKTQIKKAAPIKRLVDQRDGLINERADLLAQIRGLLEETNRLHSEIDAQRVQAEQMQVALDASRAEVAWFGEVPFVPNGHFYSPIPSMAEIHRDQEKLFAAPPSEIPGVDLNVEGQLQLVRDISQYYKDLSFPADKQEGFRYYYNNDAFNYSDGVFLNGILRYARPKRVVEVGSGYSSCMLLDTNERWLENSIDCTFIEPYPALLNRLISDEDRARITVYPTRLQDVDLSIFQKLDKNDVLFIDSTHVSRIGSDVNYLFFEILPALKHGVYIHIHDIFYPFEYPRVWVEERRAWNELYLLRAFLQYNPNFEIVAFSDYLVKMHKEFLAAHLPVCASRPGGNIWLRKQ